MQHHLVEDRPQHVFVTITCDRSLHRFRYGASEASAVFGVFGQYLPSRFSPVGRRCVNVGSECLHDILPERLLLERHLYHVNLQIEAEVGACLRQGRSPLSGSRFRRHSPETLFLRVIRLGYRRIELVASRRVVAFELVVYLRRSVEGLFKIVRPAERRRSVYLIYVHHLVRYVEISRFAVHLLCRKLFAEHGIEILQLGRFSRRRIYHGSGLLLHVRSEVIPLLRYLVFREIQPVWYFSDHCLSPF